VIEDAVGVRAEDLADLVAHELVDQLDVELGGEALLDRVDDRELGGALLAFLVEALVSSKSRAFSSATLKLLASVVRRRTWLSSYACWR
jgi:hypothetical protein